MGELDAAMRLEWGRNELGFGKVGSQEQRLAYKVVPVTEPTNYTKLSKKIIHQSRRLSKLKPV